MTQGRLDALREKYSISDCYVLRLPDRHEPLCNPSHTKIYVYEEMQNVDLVTRCRNTPLSNGDLYFMIFYGCGLNGDGDVYDESTETGVENVDLLPLSIAFSCPSTGLTARSSLEVTQTDEVEKPKYEFNKSKHKGKETAEPEAIKKPKTVPNVSSNKGIVIGSSPPTTSSISLRGSPSTEQRQLVSLSGIGEGMKEQSEGVVKITTKTDYRLPPVDLLTLPQINPIVAEENDLHSPKWTMKKIDYAAHQRYLSP
ncbi:hypothetical protein NE237_008545 [Protea cynaroides]|uniref:Uncharacterized protein n=1 Tax=Protea cynaroides TaxID=273540 RepID=A0A9Q0KW01_9MAGN|nr:hypothetical protein NE237_008545 [Protea cynaroides]